MSEVTLNPLECALDEAQALRRQVDALQAENAELRSELESVGTAAYLYGRSDLKAENAKLRGDCPENWIFSCFDNDFCAWGKPREVDA